MRSTVALTTKQLWIHLLAWMWGGDGGDENYEPSVAPGEDLTALHKGPGGRQ